MNYDLTTKTEEHPEASIANTSAGSESVTPSLPDHLLEGLIVPPSNTFAQNQERSGKRATSIAALKEAAPRLIEAADGIKMLSATTVLVLFAKLGQPLDLRCSNALGDVLGKEGLKLPFISIRGRRRYAMHMLASSDEEKAQFKAWLDGLDAASRRNLQVA